MSTKLPALAKETLVEQFNKTYTRSTCDAREAAPLMVRAMNGQRVCGILLKELLGKENISENDLRAWLRDNPGQLVEEETDWLMNTVRIANKLEGQLELFSQAPGPVVQMTLQCAGLLPAEATRELAQTSHELTPSVQSWKYATDLRVKFEGMIKSASQWDETTRAAVKDNIEKTIKFLAELEEKL
jgi:hypothetical protein